MRPIYLSCCLILTFVLTNCTWQNPDEPISLTVFAAASLTESFTAIAEAYEAAHPDIDVVISFAGSQTLRLQIEQGAKADVFASANQQHLDVLLTEKLVSEPAAFAENQLIIITTATKAATIRNLADLSQKNLKLVLAHPTVPVGQYAHEVLANLDGEMNLAPDFSQKVLLNLVSEEDNVKAVLTKVQLGEADVGLVYASDVLQADPATLNILEIPVGFNVTAAYSIATISDGDQPALAQDFIKFVLSSTGQTILAEHGFQPLSD